MSDTRFFFCCLGVGMTLAIGKVIYGMLPIFLYIDAVVFLVASSIAAAIRPHKFGAWSLALIAPAYLLILLFLGNIGLEQLKQGVGSGLGWSALIILSSSLLGGWVTSMIAGRTGSR